MSKRLSLIGAILLIGFALITAASHRADESPSTENKTLTVWTGSNNLGSWNNVLKIDASAFKDLVDFTQINIYGEGSGQIQIATENPSWTNLDGDYRDFNGSYTYNAPEDRAQIIADLKANGFRVNGRDATITKVDIVGTFSTSGGDIEEPDEPFSGVKEIQGLTFQFGDWTSFPDNADNKPEDFKVLWIKPAYMPALQKGDAVRITFEEAKGQAQYIYRGSGEWIKAGSREADNGGYWDISGTGPYTFEVNTDDKVSSLLANGLFVDANGSPKVTKVEFIYNKHAEDVPDIKADQTVDPEPSGNYELELPISKTTFDTWYDIADHKDNNGSEFVYVKPGHMPGVKAGDEIWVYFTNNGGGQANFVFQGAEKWIKVGENGSTDPDYIQSVVTGQKYVFPITAAWVAQIARNGLYIDGNKVSVDKVVFYAKDREEKPVIDDSGDIVVPGGEVLPEYMEKTTTVLWEKGKGTTDYSDVTFNGSATDEIVFGPEWKSAYPVNTASPDYTNSVHIPAARFANVNLDDKMVVTFANYGDNSEGRFCYIDTNNEGFTRGTGDAANTADKYAISSARQTRMIVNYRGAGAVRNNGLWIDARNAEIVKIEFVHYDNTALSNDDASTYPRFAGEPMQEMGNVDFTEPRGFIVEQDNAEFPSQLTSELRRVRPRAFANYRNGERIRFVFEKSGDYPWFRINFVRPHSSSMRISQGLTGTDDGIFNKDFEETDEGLVATYIPTQREIRALMTNGLFLDGSDLKLKKIIFGLDNPGDLRQNVWLHNDWVTLGHAGEGKNYEGDIWHEWDVHIYVSHSHFKRAKENGWLATETDGVTYDGYYLLFQFPWAGENAKLDVWFDPDQVHDTNRDPLNQFYEAAFPEGARQAARVASDETPHASGPQKFSFSEQPLGIPATGNNDNNRVSRVLQRLTTEDVNNMLEYGFWMNGSNADFQNVLLQSKLSVVSAIESVSAETRENLTVDLTRPYEAYTIDGRRVASAEAPGLYIVRQGNLVQIILVK